MDLDETVIHDPVLGVNIFMPIVTGTWSGSTDMPSDYSINFDAITHA